MSLQKALKESFHLDGVFTERAKQEDTVFLFGAP